MTSASPRFPAHWTPAPAQILPGRGEVVLVVADLDVSATRRTAMLETFSPRERERFESFAHEEHRFRWGASRGILREVLGRALDLKPAEIGFRFGPHGKPEVPGVRFNISHSGALAMIALAQVEVGVDVELPRARRSDDIARRFYTPGENAYLFSMEKEPRTEAFFRLWTCKEAFLKATGEGLSRSTRSFEIELGSEGARLVRADRIPDAAHRYSVLPQDVGDPYRAALVAEGQGLTLRQYLWLRDAPRFGASEVD